MKKIIITGLILGLLYSFTVVRAEAGISEKLSIPDFLKVSASTGVYLLPSDNVWYPNRTAGYVGVEIKANTDNWTFGTDNKFLMITETNWAQLDSKIYVKKDNVTIGWQKSSIISQGGFFAQVEL